MLSERMLTAVVRQCTKQYLKLEPTTDQHVPAPVPGQRYMLYLHCLLYTSPAISGRGDRRNR